ncbi:GAF domain-containing protein [Henriciella marina]|uniref:GAF domain-containing protein n=1 Tax=Henriciella marina TaxID=453851 RepID=UPI00035E79E7|nr:GAF domain-containing protein [Henriciella marina]
MAFQTSRISEPETHLPLASESERLHQLHACGILSQTEDPRFQRLVETIADFFHAPMACFSVIDAGQQILLARQGLEDPVTDRAASFCQYTIRQYGVLAVEDAAITPPFSSNPFVLGPPHIRFYAGAPVIIDRRHAIGSLCILDTEPRHLDPAETQMLDHFAVLLATMVESDIGAPDRITSSARHGGAA